MGKLEDFLTGTQILEEVDSPINGKISVIRSLVFGTYVSVGGLTQSGGVLKNIWKKTFKILKNKKTKKIKKCLILGLGGGTAAKLIGEFWPGAKITGVDIDPLMVKLGNKYLGLDKCGVNVVIGDAKDYVRLSSKSKRKFDLILVDLYIGDEFPKKFESEAFLKLILKLLSIDGTAIFNRLYSGDKRTKALKFGKKLERVFEKIDVVYPEANVMYICF